MTFKNDGVLATWKSTISNTIRRLCSIVPDVVGFNKHNPSLQTCMKIYVKALSPQCYPNQHQAICIQKGIHGSPGLPIYCYRTQRVCIILLRLPVQFLSCQSQSPGSQLHHSNCLGHLKSFDLLLVLWNGDISPQSPYQYISIHDYVLMGHLPWP